MLARGEKGCQANPFLPASYLIAQASNALPVSIFRLAIAKLGFVPHADMPLAESQPDFGLIERFDALPLPETAFPEYAPLCFRALK